MMTDVYSMNMLASLLLLFFGIAGILTQRNVIKIIICLEIMSKGVLLSFIASGSPFALDYGLSQSFAVILIIIEASVTAVALSIVVCIHRHYGTFDVEKLKRLKG